MFHSILIVLWAPFLITILKVHAVSQGKTHLFKASIALVWPLLYYQTRDAAAQQLDTTEQIDICLSCPTKFAIKPNERNLRPQFILLDTCLKQV